MANYDMQPVAKDALTILINISEDKDVLESLAGDDSFLDLLLSRITVSPSLLQLTM
jgi:hypothetical protein